MSARGWRIVHVPYYKWQRGGWLADRDDAQFKKTVADLYCELQSELGVS